MAATEFTARLIPATERGARSGVIFYLPQPVSARLPSRGIVRVALTIGGKRFRSAVFPTGDGRHYLAANKAMRQAAGANVGDTVKMALEVDTAPREVVVPPDLRKALAKSKVARAAFDMAPPSHKREYIDYVEEAKRPETRARRIEKTIERLISGRVFFSR